MKQTIDRLGLFYVQRPGALPTGAELADFRLWLADQWDSLPAPVVAVPYDLSLSGMIELYKRTGRIVVSYANNNHPVLSWSENVQFRAIHDWHHIIAGADDSLLGEMRAYQQAKSTAPRSIWWILRSEIVLQAAAFYYTGTYQVQKLVRTA